MKLTKAIALITITSPVLCLAQAHFQLAKKVTFLIRNDSSYPVKLVEASAGTYLTILKKPAKILNPGSQTSFVTTPIKSGPSDPLYISYEANPNTVKDTLCQIYQYSSWMKPIPTHCLGIGRANKQFGYVKINEKSNIYTLSNRQSLV